MTFGFKAVLWCVNCKTALAEAEMERRRDEVLDLIRS